MNYALSTRLFLISSADGVRRIDFAAWPTPGYPFVGLGARLLERGLRPVICATGISGFPGGDNRPVFGEVVVRDTVEVPQQSI